MRWPAGSALINAYHRPRLPTEDRKIEVAGGREIVAQIRIHVSLSDIMLEEIVY